MSPRRVQWITLAAGVLVVAIVLAANLWPKQKPSAPVLREVPARELTLRDGRSYWKSEAAPYTGFILEHYADGSLKSRSLVSNGLMHGVSEGWHTNGVLQVREHFHEGTSHGLREKWFPSGAKLSEAAIDNGKLHGPFRRWHENGALAEEAGMSQGQPDGLSFGYYPDGSLKAKAMLEKGKVLEQQFWKQGEMLVSNTASRQ